MGKELSYVDSGGVVVKSLTVVKRGSLIVAMVVETDQYQDIISSIIGSFTYTDNWNSYLDFEDSYSFIFPANLILTYLGNGVEVSITSEIFSILKYENSTIDQAIEDSKGEYEIVADEVDIFFHTGDTATSVTFTNTKYDKQLSRIYLSKGKDIFVLNDINIEDNFPHPNTYDDYIFEMLESFEFFDVELSSDYITFDNFQDVRDTHPNEESINSLYSDSIIEGYADGTFRPDNQINRAELTKMLVASKLEPSSEQYNNCFTDVKTEWYAPYICYAKEQGWVAGYEDGSYQPGTDINRVEALKIMLEVLFDGQIAEEEILQDASALDIDSDAWYIKYFTFADNRDLLDMQHSSASEDGYHFFPADAISRKEVAETIYRAMKIN